MAVNPISNVTVATVNSTISSHSLQAAIELVYAQVANDVLVTHLASLSSALGVTQSVANSLTELQNLHNQVSIKSTGTFPFNFAASHGGVNQYESAYNIAASAFFSGPVKLSATFPSGFASFKSQILTVKSQLLAEIASLSAITPIPSNGISNPNSLLATTKDVLNDLNKANVSTLSGTLTWLIDGYNTPNAAGGTSAGQIQQDLNNAITAAQSLNTTQTESVRSFLFLFEEYYKSASAILTQMTQIIQKMADGIAH